MREWLVQDIQEPEYSMRQGAIEGLKAVKAKHFVETIPQLVDILETRRIANDSNGWHGDPIYNHVSDCLIAMGKHAIEPLSLELSDTEKIGVTICYILTEIGDPSTIPAIAAFIKRTRSEDRLDAVHHTSRNLVLKRKEYFLFS